MLCSLFRSSHRRCSIKKMFLYSGTGAFLWILRNFSEHLFSKNASRGCFWREEGKVLFDLSIRVVPFCKFPSVSVRNSMPLKIILLLCLHKEIQKNVLERTLFDLAFNTSQRSSRIIFYFKNLKVTCFWQSNSQLIILQIIFWFKLAFNCPNTGTFLIQQLSFLTMSTNIDIDKVT